LTSEAGKTAFALRGGEERLGCLFSSHRTHLGVLI